MEGIFLRPLDLIHGIFLNNILFYCHLHCFAEYGVIVNDCVGGTIIIQNGLIEVFDVLRCYLHQLQIQRFEIR